MAHLADYSTARDLFALAVANGADRPSISHAIWHVAEDCEFPVHREFHGRPYSSERDTTVSPATGSTFRTELFLRCRKCNTCLMARRRMWAARAIREVGAAYRTWSSTLTLAPQRHYQMYSLAAKRLRLNGVDIDALDPTAQFEHRHKEISKEITRYVKRVRKSSGSLRLLLVAEAHKSGLPHYHMLWHEKDLLGTREKILSSKWTWGFSRHRLIEDKSEAAYLCKYLSKELGARVRASKFYGTNVLEHSALEHMRVEANDLRSAQLTKPESKHATVIEWMATPEASGAILPALTERT